MTLDALQPVHPLDALVQSRRVLICVGPGGVGKTTVTAAMALGEGLRQTGLFPPDAPRSASP